MRKDTQQLNQETNEALREHEEHYGVGSYADTVNNWWKEMQDGRSNQTA